MIGYDTQDAGSLIHPRGPGAAGAAGAAGAGVTWRTLNHEHFLPVEHRKRIGRVAKIYAELW